MNDGLRRVRKMSPKRSEKQKENTIVVFKEIAKTGKSVKVKPHEGIEELEKRSN